MSTSAFLHTRLAKRRPMPRMEVMAYMTFCLPSTLVLSTRRMCWNSSPAMSDCSRHQVGQGCEERSVVIRWSRCATMRDCAQGRAVTGLHEVLLRPRFACP
jgi:hypothetical protein